MRVVVEHPTHGLFLGDREDQLYWSEEHLPYPIISAVTFRSHREANEYFGSRLSRRDFKELEFHEIATDAQHASIAVLVAAGFAHYTQKLLYHVEAEGHA